MVKTTDVLTLIIDAKVKKAQQGFKSIEAVLDDIDIGVEKANKKTKKFNDLQSGLMSAGMSFLFTGMAIKNMFQNAMNGLIATFVLINGENSVVAEGINNLKAKWLFFVDSIGEAAVATGVFDKWLDRVENILDAFNSFSEDTQAFIADLVVVGFLVGTISMLVGQMMLGWLGIVMLVATGIAAPLALILIIIGSLIALVLIWKSDMSLLSKLFWSFVIVIAIIAALLTLGVAPWILIVVAIGIAIALIIKFRKHIQLAFMKAGQWIQTGLIDVLNWALEKLNKLIQMLNKIPGINIGTVGSIGTGAGIDFGSRIAELESDIATSKSQPGLVEQTKEKMGSVTQIFNVGGSVISEDDLANFTKKSVRDDMLYNGGSPQI